jgi:hypothetical protein
MLHNNTQVKHGKTLYGFCVNTFYMENGEDQVQQNILRTSEHTQRTEKCTSCTVFSVFCNESWKRYELHKKI